MEDSGQVRLPESFEDLESLHFKPTLAGLTLPYFEMTGAGDRNVNDDTARVREEAVRPLLDSGDVIQAIKEARKRYQGWKEYLADTEQDP